MGKESATERVRGPGHGGVRRVHALRQRASRACGEGGTRGPAGARSPAAPLQQLVDREAHRAGVLAEALGQLLACLRRSGRTRVSARRSRSLASTCAPGGGCGGSAAAAAGCSPPSPRAAKALLAPAPRVDETFRPPLTFGTLSRPFLRSSFVRAPSTPSAAAGSVGCVAAIVWKGPLQYCTRNGSSHFAHHRSTATVGPAADLRRKNRGKSSTGVTESNRPRQGGSCS